MAKKQQEMRRGSGTAKRGVFLFFVMMIAILGVCFGRIAYIVIVKGDEYREKAENQQLSDTVIPAARGTIYDRNMNILAQSANAWIVCVNPSKVTDNNRDKVLDLLCEYLGEDRAALAQKISDNAGYRYLRIKSKVEHNVKQPLMEAIAAADEAAEKADQYLGLSQAIFTDSDTKRYYPNGSLASTIIGFTGTDGNGLYGLENLYDETLKGTDGRMVTAKDGRQVKVDNAYETTYEAKPGANLVLTIDSEIQTILESALETALRDNNALNVYGIVMETKTGALLAVANLPDYDPNTPYEILYPELTEYFAENGTEKEKEDPVAAARMEQWKNKSIADFYYPGSVYKVFLVSGAYEEGVIDENTSYTCYGTITVRDRTIKDFNPTGHGTETPCTLLVNSCNCFSVYVGQQMGAEMYYKYFQGFGFAERTGVDLSGESTPMVDVTYHDPDVSFTYSDLASASFGQSISVTPLQVVTAISAIGNGGYLMQPYVVERELDSRGNAVKITEPQVKRQVISKETAATVAGWMEEVVNDGTGKNAYVAGYRVAGKTGTSEKLGVAEDAYIASFSGFAPADDPEISVVIIIDDPKGDSYSGGVIAAPIAGEVIEKTLQYLGVEPTYSGSDAESMTIAAPQLVGLSVEEARSKLQDYDYTYRIVGEGGAIVSQMPEAGRFTPVNGVMVLYTEQVSERESTVVPDFTGLTIYQANRLAVENDLNLRIAGSNADESSVVAYKQEIAPNTKVECGAIVTVTFRTTSGIHD